MRVYLAGAIRYAKDPFTWRLAVAKVLPDGWEAVDPTQIELFVENEDDYEGAKRIVSGDLRAIETCDAMIAFLNIPSWGTAMEMFYASQLKIPVIGWNPDGTSVGPWVRVHCTDIHIDFEGIKLFLQNLLVKA